MHGTTIKITDIPFLSLPAKERRATISFAMSVLLSAYSSVCMEQLGSHWTDFHEI
jgi:hypothetical protein